MRLKDFERTAIRSTIAGRDPQARIYLLGLRVDDAKKGGDIDHLVVSEHLTRDDGRTIKTRLYELLGEQKIDIVLAADLADPFAQIALAGGVAL